MKIEKGFIPLFKGIDIATRRLPFMAAASSVKGPVVWLTAAIHGDEVTGTAVIQSIFKRLEDVPLKSGKLFAFPILNPTGFETISRHEPYDERDLNRCFGGDMSGETSERLAAMILNKILETKPDYVIDLHTDSMNSIAYTIVDLPKEIKDIKSFIKSISIAGNLGFRWAIETERIAGYPLERSLTGYLVMKGIPAVTLELGGPLVVMEDFRKLGVERIWHFLCSLGMIDGQGGALVKEKPEYVYIFEERLKTQSTGIIEYRVKPGEQVSKGRTLGKIRNIFGETIEIIRSPFEGILVSHEDQSVAFPGQALFSLIVKSEFKELASEITLKRLIK